MQQSIGQNDPAVFATAKENQYFDRKSARIKPNDAARHIVAFANAAGGKLVIGIEDDGEIEIRPEDLRIDTYRASGAGGQHVNRTDSAVRITHIPTNTVVTCQDEKSQHKNKASAMKVLASRILQHEREKQMALQSADRKAQVGSGDRSERIRTYNFPQGRCTDHRINLTLYSLDKIMEGEIDPLVEGMVTHAQAEALKAQSSI